MMMVKESGGRGGGLTFAGFGWSGGHYLRSSVRWSTVGGPILVVAVVSERLNSFEGLLVVLERCTAGLPAWIWLG